MSWVLKDRTSDLAWARPRTRFEPGIAFGWTSRLPAFLIALHEAVGNEHLSVVNYLVLHGAELNTRNSRGLTPLGLLTSPAPTSGGTSGQEGGSAKGPTEQLLRELGGIQ